MLRFQTILGWSIFSNSSPHLSGSHTMKRTVLSIALGLSFSVSALGQAPVATPEPGTAPTPAPTQEATKTAPQEPAKPADTKPAEVKTTEVKPADVKPAEAKPAAGKPAVENPPMPTATPQEPAKEVKAETREETKPQRKRLPHIGSMNSAKIPGQPWRIHDALRPRPPVVTPGQENHLPPSDAIILFDGKDLSNWCHRGEEDEFYEAEWKIIDGTLEVAPRTGNLYTLDSFSSCQLHIEWQIPEGTKGTSQGRGNSGIKLMERFEIQVLDSFNNRTYADGQAGSIYGQYPPMVNAVRKQGEWQAYDIFFEAPVFENDKLVRPASVTLLHNGVLVQLHRELAGPTGAREPKYTPMQPAAPLMLQDHGNKIRYRNIWIRPL